MRAFMSYLFVLMLGLVYGIAFFMMPFPGIGPQLPSKEVGWILHTVQAAGMCAISCFVERLTIMRAAVFCAPLMGFSLLLGMGNDGAGLKYMAEPILSVGIGAAFVWLASCTVAALRKPGLIRKS